MIETVLPPNPEKTELSSEDANIFINSIRICENVNALVISSEYIKIFNESVNDIKSKVNIARCLFEIKERLSTLKFVRKN